MMKIIKKIKISHKVYFLAIFGVVISVLIAAGSLYAIKQVGVKIVQIAEEDIPLTQKVTSITIHQLEQSILFERAGRYAETMVHKPSIKDKYDKTKLDFFKMGKKVDEEIVDAENTIDKIVEHELKKHGSSELAKKFSETKVILEKIRKEHKSFEKHADEVFKYFDSAQLSKAEKGAEVVKEEEEKLNHELENIVKEISNFTADAALSAEHLEHKIEKILTISSIVLAVVFMVVAFVIVRSVIKPLEKTKHYADELSEGNLESEQPNHMFEDEIGDLLVSLGVFKENALEKERLEKEQKLAEQKAEEDKKKAMHDLAQKFENEVQGMINSVAAAATELSQTAESMNGNIGDVTQKAGSASQASQNTAQNVNTVASASEEMSSSVKEITNQISQSTTVVNDAVSKAGKAEESAQSLQNASNEIGGVIDLIRDIAEQINLLALNATIESARAGEAGKGFAVVASEVKNLASQTTKATEQISSQIGDMQGISTEVSDSLATIKEAIDKVNEYSSGISAAAQQQEAATAEIANSMQTAAKGTQDVNDNVDQITASASHASESSNQMYEASVMLSRDSEQLSAAVSNFLQDIRNG